MRPMARPIWELGVEAPAVRPMRTGPSGSQPCSSISSRLSSGVWAGLWWMVSPSMQSPLAMWKLFGTLSEAMMARLLVLEEL